MSKLLCVTDITAAASVESLASRCKETFQRLNCVVSNPAYPGPVTLKVTEGEPEWFQENFDVNVVGTYHIAHHPIPLLDSSTGIKSFIVIRSFASCIITGHTANTGYCLRKMAQSTLVEHLAAQFPDLLAFSVHPGAVVTASAVPNTPEKFLPYLTYSIDLCGAFCI